MFKAPDFFKKNPGHVLRDSIRSIINKEDIENNLNQLIEKMSTIDKVEMKPEVYDDLFSALEDMLENPEYREKSIECLTHLFLHCDAKSQKNYQARVSAATKKAVMMDDIEKLNIDPFTEKYLHELGYDDEQDEILLSFIAESENQEALDKFASKLWDIIVATASDARKSIIQKISHKPTIARAISKDPETINTLLGQQEYDNAIALIQGAAGEFDMRNLNWEYIAILYNEGNISDEIINKLDDVCIHHGTSILHEMIRNNSEETQNYVKAFSEKIKNNVDLEPDPSLLQKLMKRNANKLTPFHFAIRQGIYDNASTLLSIYEKLDEHIETHRFQYGDVLTDLNPDRHSYRNTPLETALNKRQPNESFIKTLLKLNTPRYLGNIFENMSDSLAMDAIPHVNSFEINEQGETLLHRAIRNNNIEMLEKILAHTTEDNIVSLLAQNDAGESIFELALRAHQEMTNITIGDPKSPLTHILNHYCQHVYDYHIKDKVNDLSTYLAHMDDAFSFDILQYMMKTLEGDNANNFKILCVDPSIDNMLGIALNKHNELGDRFSHLILRYIYTPIPDKNPLRGNSVILSPLVMHNNGEFYLKYRNELPRQMVYQTRNAPLSYYIVQEFENQCRNKNWPEASNTIDLLTKIAREAPDTAGEYTEEENSYLESTVTLAITHEADASVMEKITELWEQVANNQANGKCHLDLDHRNHNGETLLDFIEKQASPLLPAAITMGYNPFSHMLFGKYGTDFDKSMLDRFIKHQSSAIHRPVDDKGNTPLHLIVQTGDTALVQHYLDNAKPRLFTQNKEGKRARNVAISPEMKDLLKQYESKQRMTFGKIILAFFRRILGMNPRRVKTKTPVVLDSTAKAELKLNSPTDNERSGASTPTRAVEEDLTPPILSRHDFFADQRKTATTKQNQNDEKDLERESHLPK